MSAVIRLGFTASVPGLPKVSASDLEGFEEYELSAIAHWIFTGGSASLNDLKSGRRLDGPPHTYLPNSILIAADGESALSTGILDTDSMCICVVFKWGTISPVDATTRNAFLAGVTTGDNNGVSLRAMTSGVNAGIQTPLRGQAPAGQWAS